MCAGACREKLLCTTFILPPRFLTHSVSLKAPRMPCKNWAPSLFLEDAKSPSAAPLLWLLPLFFLSLLFFFKRLFVCASPSLEHGNPRLCESCVRSEVTHCPLVHAPPPPHISCSLAIPQLSIAAALLLSVVQVENRGVWCGGGGAGL